MGVEIERKFLIKDSTWRAYTNKEIEIRQGYLNSQKERTVRVRIFGEIGMLTIKGETVNATRDEFEYEIPLKDALKLLELCEQPIVEKIRFQIMYKNKVWEVDEFRGVNDGLIVAEIELQEEDEEIELPDWVGKEVTMDPKYYNSNLITHPYKNW